MKTEADSKVEQPIVVKEKELELDVLIEIPDFDEDTYISDTFNTVFHSLQIEDWSIEYKRDSISFTRSKVDNQSRRVSQIKLNVEFTFNHKKDKNGDYIKGKSGELQKEFTISRINLCPPDGGSGFVFQGVLKKEHLKYLYDIYVKYKSGVNTVKRNKVDIALKSINEMVGLSSIRDSKLTELLG